MSESEESSQQPSASSGHWKKLAVLAVVVVAAILVYMQFGDALSLQYLAAQENELRQYRNDYPILVYGAAFAIYVAATGLSIPGAAVLTLVYGWYFGFVPAVVLVSFASTAGATVAFLLSRYLLRQSIQNRFGERLAKFNQALEREGPFYLFTLRLIPAVPFFVINVVMGLTPVRAWTFWWVSQVGMIPGTIVYVYAGSSVPDLQTLADKGAGGILTLNVLIAFAVLGLFPLVLRFVLKRFRSPSTDTTT